MERMQLIDTAPDWELQEAALDTSYGASGQLIVEQSTEIDDLSLQDTALEKETK